MNQCTCGRSSSYPYCDSTHKTDKYGLINKISEKSFIYHKDDITEKNIFNIKINKIAELKNFINKKTCNSLIAFIDSLSENDFVSTAFYGAKVFDLKEKEILFNDLDKNFLNLMLEKNKNAIEILYGIKFKNVTSAVQVWPPGSEAVLHSDSTDVNGNIKVGMFKKFKFSSIIYLNEDYLNGELEFPEHNISLKPATGSALFFSGGIENLHKINLVGGDKNRYTISITWDLEDAFYSEEEVASWEEQLNNWSIEMQINKEQNDRVK
jgi:hypothetical protein